MMIKKLLALVFLFLTQSVFALTQTQKDELYHFGTVSVFDEAGAKLGHYEVTFMPGTANIRERARLRWHKAADLMDDFLDRHEFWEKKFVGSFLDGIKTAREGFADGIFNIPNDLRETLAENNRVSGQFGSMASKLKNWIGFTGLVGGRVLRSLYGVGTGTIYALAVPTGHVLYRPIAAGTQALVAGTLWPVVKYSWNGSAWILTKNSNEPKSTDMTVTFIPVSLEHYDDVALPPAPVPAT